MLDQDKTKEQLIAELAELRQLLRTNADDTKNQLQLKEMVKTSASEISEGDTELFQEIKDNNQTRKALQSISSNYYSLVELSPDGIAIELNGTIAFINTAGANIFGAETAKQIIGKTLSDIIHPDYLSIVQDRINKARDEGTTNPFLELKYLRIDGTAIHVEASSARCFYDGKPAVQVVFREITQRKQMDEALQRSELQYRSVVETSSDAIITANIQNKIISWNKGAETVFGYTAAEILNNSLFTLVPERLHAAHSQKIMELSSSKPNTVMIAQNPSWGKRKDGSEFFAEASAAKWETEEGSFMTLTLRDITQRHMIENALRRSEEQYRSVIETASDAIITTDLQGTIITWNKGAENIYGYSADEIINKSFIVLFPEHFTLVNQNRMLEHFAQHNMGIIFQDTQIPAKRKDGREFHAEGSVSKWESHEGIFLTAIVRDITDRKLAEDSLIQSEERYRLTADTVPVQLAAIDMSGKFVLWNKYSENMFGYTQEEVLNKLSPLDIHETAEEAQEVIDTTLKKGIFDKELRLRRKDGSSFFAHLIVVPNKNIFGEITGLYGFAEDITTRKKAEDIVSQVDNCLLSLTPDPDSNICYLVESAGKILGGDCSAYHSIRGSSLNIKAEWNIPVAHTKMYSLKGSPFLHLLSQYGAEPFIINNEEELAHVTNESLSFHVPYKILLAIPVRTGNRITGSLHIAYSQPQAFSKTELNAFSILSKAISIEEERKKTLIELKRKQKLLSKSEKALKLFSAKVLSIREEEKKLISSALHDEIGSTVVALSAQLALAKFEIIENNLDQAIRNIAQTEATLKQSVEKLKSIAVDLRPPDLNIVGLSTALKNYFLSLSEKINIAIDFTSTLKDRSIPEATAIILYRVCQEALNNATSHAKARTVSVQLTSKRGYINLVIQDDGCGFDLNKLPNISSQSSKLGIIGMRERVESLGGTFAIESHINKGTALFATVPHR